MICFELNWHWSLYVVSNHFSAFSYAIFLAEILSRVLITMADDELHSGALAIPHSDLVEFSTFLKAVTLDLYWTGIPPWFESEAQGLTVRESFTRLLRQLHLRDSRRSFCPPRH